MAGFRSWRLFQKSFQGSGFFSRSAKVAMLKVPGSSAGFTSAHSSGVETGARGNRRTQKGDTTVCANPFRNGSR